MYSLRTGFHALAAAVLPALAVLGCIVGDEAAPASEQAEDVPYSDYVCAFAPLTPEGECSLDRACTASACLRLYGECDYYGYTPVMYPIIVDGTCACYFHCDLGGGGDDGGGGGGGGDSDCEDGRSCDGPSDCGDGLCDSSNECWCGAI